MKIWILTSKFGQGHFSAAKALEEEFVEYGHDVIISDIMELIHPKFHKTIYSVFNNIICRNTAIYNYINEFGRNIKERNKANKHLKETTKKIAPDIIITTWSACARILGNVPIPVYVCITDVGVHKGWLFDGVQGYLVANTDVEKKLISMGIEKERIYIRGIPVKKVFYMTTKINSKVKRVLIMGGGLGILPCIDNLLDDLITYSEIQITVITGNNRKLYNRLLRKYPCITVVGYTNEVYRYIANADLLVSKPGGITLFESIYMQTPFVAVFPEYKQEIENSMFILQHEIGAVVWRGQSVSKCIIEILKNETYKHKLRTNILLLKQEIDNVKKNNNWWDYKNVI